MATTTISPIEHRQVALDFLVASDEEFERGDALQGAEKLWGAAAHCIMSVAQERDWPHQSYPVLKNTAGQIAEEYDDPLIAGYFSVAEKFHRHFYHDSMEEWKRDVLTTPSTSSRTPRPDLRVAVLADHPVTPAKAGIQMRGGVKLFREAKETRGGCVYICGSTRIRVIYSRA